VAEQTSRSDLSFRAAGGRFGGFLGRDLLSTNQRVAWTDSRSHPEPALMGAWHGHRVGPSPGGHPKPRNGIYPPYLHGRAKKVLSQEQVGPRRVFGAGRFVRGQAVAANWRSGASLGLSGSGGGRSGLGGRSGPR